ncbi:MULTISPECIES: Trk system potassium transporter TrkA [unclassified Colwellia]|uniref:Trk system potassium transporter TrkA n=1 Tax=unclassified Colwellia TaxID=196834 RepID=UPI0015F3D551|nr:MULTISPECIES: Trk system potassium transporter TrkA [unclassified Colwellia]MBA6231489.1 Trk system potassium transporter TrkA [Colwellia sp. MB02u-7]MBA6238420.1 Trk system potassium transporter TrkA [Colwellia sp. MB02u-11]MBA6255194.1 Trk system potassium transporter TrkA [Colwellia sp. MB3u-28]MBA6260769.1 Trk system potassium transporter TrkA [Colwellia sp. MB3u-41]MBA6299622.1 Trk system potassium transporter TrkA [Colwellia sp. MB3u-22]
MKIIIIGAGQVGGTLAENLVGERNDITIIDTNAETLHELQDKMDLQVVVGNGSHPDILKQAGAEDAELVIAVSSDDATNMLACQICYSLFNTANKIARIRSSQILRYQKELFQSKNIPVDHVIAPEQLVTRDIARLIDYPGALQVLEFAQGKVSLVAVKAYYGGLLVGHALSTLREHIPNVDTRVAAIYRNGKPIRPLGTTVIEADDEVFFIAATIHIRAVMNELQKLEASYKRIMIAGGGNIGAGLAKILEKNHQVKLIERSPKRAEYLASELNDTLVFIGDSSDQELLLEEHIDQFDVFIAVTNDDEANIMSSLLAKRLGVRKAMVLIQRSAYIDLVHGSEIDIAVSPQHATISALLTHVRRGSIDNVYSLRGGAAEAIEIIAKGDEKSSKVVGKTIQAIKLPPGTTIGAIVRQDEVLIAHSDTKIMSEDHVILFLVNKRYIYDVEKLFHVDALTFY